ncbi:hypothetical protein MLD38_013880 [Melastoma candidum]|uniref:Uncharacterized protein n=1 Tax=Melastoma candidum TaxID=119954 RepID=A0ACB9RE36_9MYRT|nr:hypothetical protein MLD38_013880 [Melastoma candidum]
MPSLAILPERRMANAIRAVVTLRQMLKRWRHESTPPRTPSQVPVGHVAVYVGSNRKRYVVRATYLNHPTFKRVLAEAEEEFGFPAEGPLVIPCEESLFEDILASLASRSTTHNKKQGGVGQRCSSHVGIRGRLSLIKALA